MKGKDGEKQLDSEESVSGREVRLVLYQRLSVVMCADPNPEMGRCAGQVLDKYQLFLGGELMV